MTRGKVGMEAVSIVPRPAHLNTAGDRPGQRLPRRPVLGALLAARPPPAARCCCPARPGPSATSSKLRFARLHLPDLPNPRPSALRRLAWEIERRTSLVTLPDPVELRATDPELFRHPFLVLSGDRGFAPPPDAEVVRLRRFLTYGGFLLIDSAEGRASGRFDESVRKLLARALPGDLPARVADDHVIWKSFYVLQRRGRPHHGRALPRGGGARPPPGGGLHPERSRAARWPATASAAGSTRSSPAAKPSASRPSASRSTW